jgi:hypothetical protein
VILCTKKNSDKSWSLQVIKKPIFLKKIGFFHLPLPNLLGDFQLQNAAGVLMVLELLNKIPPRSPLSKSENFAVPESAIYQGLVNVTILIDIAEKEIHKIVSNIFGLRCINAKSLASPWPTSDKGFGERGQIKLRNMHEIKSSLRIGYSLIITLLIKSCRSYFMHVPKLFF